MLFMLVQPHKTKRLIISKSILEAVVLKVNEAHFFSVLMDKTADVSHREQVSMIVHFVDIATIINDTEIIQE